MHCDELAALTRAATVLNELDPATVWHLDDQLAGLAKLATTLAEGVSAWSDRLHQTGLDASITDAADMSADQLSAIAVRMSQARRDVRRVYGPQLAAAESTAWEIRRAGFWGDAPAGSTALPAPAGPVDDTDDEQVDDTEVEQIVMVVGSPDPDPTCTGMYFGSDDDAQAPYFDWSSQHGGSWRFEVGDGTGAVGVDLPPAKVEELIAQLAIVRGLAEHGPDGRPGEVILDDSYIGFSVTEDGRTQFEVGENDGKAFVALSLTDEHLDELHGRLRQRLVIEQSG